MFVINNKAYYTPKEQAKMAFEDLVAQGYLVEYESFVAGYLAAVAHAKDQQ